MNTKVTETFTSELETEIAVIGLGYSGAAALRAATEAGADCIGIEAQREENYHSYGRDFGHINSTFLKSRGVPEVDPVDLFNEWMRRAGNRANPSLVMQFCQKSGKAFDWFTDMYTLEDLKDLHVAFWPCGGQKLKSAQGKNAIINGYRFWYGTAEFPEKMGWPGKPTITDCVKANIKTAQQAGARLFWSTEAIRLEKAEGRVIGVIVRRADGILHRIRTSKAVILAAGDFSGNYDLVDELCCDCVDICPPGKHLPPRLGRNGSGIRIGREAGGRLESRPLPTMGGNFLSMNAPYSYGAVWFNQNGERFCNEVFGGPELAGFAGNQMENSKIYCVFDEHILENELQWAFPSHGSFDENNPLQRNFMQRLLQLKEQPTIELKLPPPVPIPAMIYTGKTPEKLIQNAGLAGKTARNILCGIERYNTFCHQGKDEEFGRDPKLLDPLTDTLFLQVVEPMSLMLVTVGGFVTDGTQRVLDENYHTIEGLYATGNCCGRRFGIQYSTPISGVSIGIAVTLGREAGRNAANKSF